MEDKKAIKHVDEFFFGDVEEATAAAAPLELDPSAPATKPVTQGKVFSPQQLAASPDNVGAKV